MRPGQHVIRRSSLTALQRYGVDVPEPRFGLIDVLRLVEGHLSEPPEGVPLGITGVTALLRATQGDAAAVLQAARTGLVEARRYFAWKRIPLVLLVEGDIDAPANGSGLVVIADGRRWSLTPLLGTRLEPALAGVDGWWWAPQIG